MLNVYEKYNKIAVAALRFRADRHRGLRFTAVCWPVFVCSPFVSHLIRVFAVNRQCDRTGSLWPNKSFACKSIIYLLCVFVRALGLAFGCVVYGFAMLFVYVNECEC